MTSPPPRSRTLSRRAVLGGLGASLALAACGRSEEPGSTVSISPSVAPPPSQDDLVGDALEAVGVDADLRLTPILFVPELLTGPDQHLQFGLVDIEQQAQPGLELDVWLVDQDGQIAAGPVRPTFYAREGIQPTGGLYHALVNVGSAGTYDLVIATSDGSVAGAGVVQLVTPSQAVRVPPGQPFPSQQTPTRDDPMEVADICTREPECELHEVSLDAALTNGRPTVLTVTSPAHCATTYCGVVVDAVQQVFDGLHQEHHDKFGDHDEGIQWLSGPNFIHVEAYADAGTTQTPLAKAQEISGDPWTWIIGADGIVLDRIGGPVVPEVLAPRIASLCPDTNCIDPAEASEQPTDPTASESASADDSPSEGASDGA